MKKMVFVLAMSLVGITYSYGYNNSVDIFHFVGSGHSPSQSVNANVFSYGEFYFMVNANAPYSYMGSCGTVGVKHNGVIIEQVSLSRYANSPTTIWYSTTRTGNWQQLQLAFSICPDNINVHAAIIW